MSVHDRKRPFPRLFAAVALAACTFAASPARAQVEGLEIIAPASPGGGWDQHARALQQVLQDNGLASNVQVMNIPGAGGTIGLAQFVTSRKRNPTLLVGGQIMQGAILMNNSPVTLEQVTPLARLTGEYTGVIVPTSSPLQSLSDLVDQFESDPGSVSWGGGSAGGSDQILAGLIAEEIGVEPENINYVATAGGGELLSQILGGHITVALGGYNEFAPQIDAGKLRPLAVSAPERLPGIDTPTLKEQGIDLEYVNWRGIFAPDDVNPAELQEFDEMIAAAVESEQWQQLTQQRGWIDLYMPSEEFDAFLEEEHPQIESTLQELGLSQ